ncbi:MAG: hypothetical protein HKN85_07255, partial [Gammaproteobacteria bacterium]|nr:hypothetical protein [Gammaproteobacteria bacterium]
MNAPIVVCALYKFTTLTDYQALRNKVLSALLQNQLRGTLLLAEEGINGTISGSATDIDAFLEWLQSDRRFADIDFKLSRHATQPFH